MSITSGGLGQTRASLTVITGLTVALLITGCGTSSSGRTGGPTRVPAGIHRLFPGFGLRYGGTARLARALPPPSSALPGASDLLAVNGGVLAATGRGIFSSADGGVSWHQVLSGVSAWSLTSVLAGGYAALGTRPASDGAGPAVLATSGDGVHWQVRRLRAPAVGSQSPGMYRLKLSSLGRAGVGIAVPDAVQTSNPARSLRSTNGGRTWTLIRSAGPRSLPSGAANGVAMTPGVEYVTAPGRGARCAGAVYRSTDAGSTWSLLAGSCQPEPLLAVQFLSPGRGFAAGGMPAKYGGGQVVEATSDGGRTWRTTWRTQTNDGAAADDGVVRLDMLTRERGWLLTGGCVNGENGPCGGTAYSTSDGGYRWYRTGQGATSLAGFGSTGERAVTGDDRSATSATTSDDGQTWTYRTPPGWLSTAAFSGAGGTQVWQNNLGDYVSTDAGAHWMAATALEGTRFSYETWFAGPPDRLLGFAGGTDLRTVASDDGGRSLTTLAVPDPRKNAMVQTAALGARGSAIAVTGEDADCLTAAQLRKGRRRSPAGARQPARPCSSPAQTAASAGPRPESCCRSASASPRPPRSTGNTSHSSTRAADCRSARTEADTGSLTLSAAGSTLAISQRCDRSCGSPAKQTRGDSGCSAPRTEDRPGRSSGCPAHLPGTGVVRWDRTWLQLPN